MAVEERPLRVFHGPRLRIVLDGDSLLGLGARRWLLGTPSVPGDGGWTVV